MEKHLVFTEKTVHICDCNPFVINCKIFNFFTNIHPKVKGNVQNFVWNPRFLTDFDIYTCAKFIKS